MNGVLEQARADKRIGKALEAQVRLEAVEISVKQVLDSLKGMDLAELFLVSGVSVGGAELPAAGQEGVSARGGNFPGLRITVSAAEGTKCPRCWMHSTQANAEGLCPRCAKVVEALL